MTIDQTTGILYFVFYDRRNTSANLTDVYVARSTDGGETFTNFKVSESSFDPNQGVFFGDYTNIAAFNKKVYPIWMRLDTYTLTVWTALINDSSANVNVESNDFNANLTDFKLSQNYPNPFNPITTIEYQIPKTSFVTVKVYDVLGKEVITLVNEEKPAGIHEVNFESKDLTSGLYLYKISASGFEQTKKMLLLK